MKYYFDMTNRALLYDTVDRTDILLYDMANRAITFYFKTRLIKQQHFTLWQGLWNYDILVHEVAD